MTRLFKQAQNIVINCPDCGKIKGYKIQLPKKPIDCPKCGMKEVPYETEGLPYDVPAHS